MASKSRPIWAVILLTVLCLSLAIGSSPVARGQGFFRPVRGTQSGRFIEAPRSIQQQLREAKRALDEGRESDAVVRLGDLLAVANPNQDDIDLSGQDFFLGLDESRRSGVPVQRSLLREAREMIGKLPPEAMETYQLRYGPLSRKLLSEAAAVRDWEKVREVRRKYFHTLAGYEASALLAQHEMFSGHPMAASLLLDDVVTVRRALDHLGRSVVLLHAAAAVLAGRDLPSVEVADDEVVLNGVSQPWPNRDDLPQWIAERFGNQEEFDVGQIDDYALMGARANRNGASSGQLPLTNLRWKLDTTASPSQTRSVHRLADELSTGGKLPPPSWTPLRVGDQLLMRTTERLVGVDYRTGKRIWVYPWQSAYELFDEEESSLDELTDGEDRNDLLTQRVWNDVPYGQITSDGERVYILDKLREVEAASFSPIINLRGTRPADTGTNTLVALDLASEGKLRWRLGSDSERDDGLSDAFFLGPPLPLDGRLYVMAEIAGDINLCCLDPVTGNELWRQQLVAVESGGIDLDPIRRVGGAMPTYHEGVLICPTGAGAIVAIDLSDRMLRWGVNYDRNREMSISVRGRGRGVDPSQLMQRWFSGVAIAAEGAVLVTPIESDRLFGFDLLTGASLFAQQSRKYMRYLAGIRDGKFFVVGASQVQAFDLRNGEIVWTTSRDMLAAGQHICGVGVFGEDDYFLPTTSNQIIQISLQDGSVKQRRNTQYPLGNLVAARGEIIVQGPASLAVAFGQQTLEPLVNRILEQDPDNFDALVRKSELLIQRGERDEALELLSRARGMQPDNDEVRMLSVSAMLGRMRDDLSVDPQLVETLDALIDRPSQRVELLSLRIRAALASGDFREAARRMIDLSSLIVEEPLLESSADQVISDNSRQCSLDSWLSARVREMINTLDEADVATISELVQQSIESKRQASTSYLKRIVRHFGALPGADLVRNELAQRLSSDEAHLELERLALGSQIPTDDGLEQLSADRLLMLAEAYASGGIPQDAVRALDELASRTDNELMDRVAELRELAASQMGTIQWPKSVQLTWGESRSSRIRAISVTQRVAKTRIAAGRQFEGWRLVSEGTNPAALRDPNGQLRRIAMDWTPADDIDKEAQICGGVMVVVMTDGLMGLDMYHLLAGDGEALLWRRGLSGDSSPVAKRRSKVTPLDDQVVRYYVASSATSNVIPEFVLGPIMGDRVVLLQAGDLLAIDLFTAETLWRNSTAPKSGSVMCDGERVAVVSSATGEVAFYDLLDGRKLDSTPWNHGAIWESAGTHVLSYLELENRRFELRLVNPFTGEVVLRHQTPPANRSNADRTIPCAYGRVVDERFLAVLDNSGRTIIWDLVEGRQVGQPELPEYADLQGLRALTLDGQLILLPSRASKPSRDLKAESGSFHQSTHGVFAISLDDGSLRWSREFETPWGCTLTQPSATPMLMLTRNRSQFSATNPTHRKFLDVLALDVRDGSELNEFEGKPIQTNNNELATRLTVQPVVSRVIVHIGTEILTYAFRDDQAVDD